MGFGENVAKMEKGTIDRISELPEFILHTILSMLDTKEACRASVLSKRWYTAWSSIPVLDFQSQYFQKSGDSRYNCDDDTIERFVGFIDKTMERYFALKFRITKMYLWLPKVDEVIGTLVDKWIMIAVQNQIQRLEIQIGEVQIGEVRNRYKLPGILFCAKSLKYFECSGVVLPFFETMELVSLEYLILVRGTIDNDMLQRIISSCPLVELEIGYSEGLTKISLPWMKKVSGGAGSSGNGTMQSNLQEYPLQKFVCRGLFRRLPLPWSMNVAVLRNLRELEFDSIPIRGDIISELSYGLVVLESLVISECFPLECINISSNSLKQLEITNNFRLMKATIDAPKLVKFLCTCDVKTSISVIRALDHCSTRFFSLIFHSAVWLAKFKKFLFETNFFKSAALQYDSSFDSDEILVEEEQLRNVGTAPYKLRELELVISCVTSSGTPTKSSLLAFLNGLFWCCHPNALSIKTNLQDAAVKLILSILQEKAECCMDPLKNIEVESINQLFRGSVSMFVIRLKLSW